MNINMNINIFLAVLSVILSKEYGSRIETA